MIQIVNSLRNNLITVLKNKDVPLGLSNGKMGFCIYFYLLSSIDNNSNYSRIADDLLDEIFEEIGELDDIDIKNGLAGIGLGINYLIKNGFVDGDINALIKEIDDTIFLNLSYPKYYEKIDFLTFIQTLYYMCIRLQDQPQSSENEYLYKELIIHSVNRLQLYWSSDFFDEPVTYDIDFFLPKLLFVLSEIYKLGFYNYRVMKIIEELSYKVLSTIPILQSNKLHLLWGIKALNKQIKDKMWERHMIILKDQIDIDHILNYELNNKNIFFKDGIVSIYFLVDNLQNIFTSDEIESIKYKIISRINSSEVWSVLQDKQLCFERYLGLYDGFIGTDLLLHKSQLTHI
ncbi:MAG: hypothetical protein RL662_104 [Bacteroidota bacterium]|jgi:hypothetical protein